VVTSTLKLTARQKARSFHLPVEQAVYVPSTKGVNKKISPMEMRKRVNEVKRYLSNKFGGFTAIKGQGGYYSKGKGVVQEKVVKVVSFAEEDKFKKNQTKLIKQNGT